MFVNPSLITLIRSQTRFAAFKSNWSFKITIFLTNLLIYHYLILSSISSKCIARVQIRISSHLSSIFAITLPQSQLPIFPPYVHITILNIAESQLKLKHSLILSLHIYLIYMYSASTRFNSITLFSFTVIGAMSVINFFQGYLTFNPNVPVNLQINSITNFISTSKWDQASFKYSLSAGKSS